ncbi:uncharacterized protein GLRG_04975 [Colletotrichum graminicola M1.001]|uniref:Uncharacterized protein n=1 Tax=Colletotrichum graminicola (strain M1.001 / M2 / FGSC 10212) TaxID=645133 RepID=E3QFZ6_COLGM|nr:uncharacterized protein GLRG_04975 [Colletotrichum graminicola M1.001]EFQ29831.1 hypothetical protein GLRG_04975 [Colletotrichum graminicola M1.001]
MTSEDGLASSRPASRGHLPPSMLHPVAQQHAGGQPAAAATVVSYTSITGEPVSRQDTDGGGGGDDDDDGGDENFLLHKMQ